MSECQSLAFQCNMTSTPGNTFRFLWCPSQNNTMHNLVLGLAIPVQLTRKPETTEHTCQKKFTPIHCLFIIDIISVISWRTVSLATGSISIPKLPMFCSVAGWLTLCKQNNLPKGDLMNKWFRSRTCSEDVDTVTIHRICFQKNSVQSIPGFMFSC